jgi:hypothetical protein
MPELDSHDILDDHPDPLNERFSPWHAVGPPSAYPTYLACMKRHSRFRLESAILRLAPEDEDTIGATQQWSQLFGINIGHNPAELQFTNAKMIFVPGEIGKQEGLVEVTIGVEGDEKTHGIMKRAAREGLIIYGNCVEMLGIRWRFLYSSSGEILNSRL